VALVDRDGVAKFSMRRLADELGVSTMAVYHHFPNKAEVLQAAADQVWIEAVLAMEVLDDPVESLVQSMMTMRRTFRAHAEVTPFAFASPTTEEAIHVSVVWTADGYERVGFRGADVAHAYNAVATFTLGSALIEAERAILDRAIRQPISELGDLAPEEAAGAATGAGADRESYRALREVMGADPDLVHFERGLRDIIAGLIARYVDP
jgi:AcrR family transcriptional regulator